MESDKPRPIQIIRTFEGHKEYVSCLTVWNNHLWSASYDKTIRVWNFEGECLRILKGHTDWVRCLTSWRDFLISGSNDLTIRVWNDNGECVTQWNTGSYVYAVTLWNGLLCTAQDDNTIKIWSDFNQLSRTLNGHTQWVECLVVHEDYLFSGTYYHN